MKCWIVLAGACLATLGCGGDGASEGSVTAGPSETETEPARPATVQQLRVDIAGTDAAPRIVRARLFDIASDALPAPTLVGAAVLVGYGAHGAVTVATPFSLPTALRLEHSLDGAYPDQQIPLAESSATLYLDASDGLSRVDVLGASGDVLATLSADEFELAAAGPKLRTLQLAGAPSPREVLQNAFPQIDFLGPGDDLGFKFSSSNPFDPVSGGPIEIGEKAGATIQAALTRMSKAALGAVRTLALARTPGLDGVTYGSTIVLSSLIDTDEGALLQTTVHESTHAFQYLTDGEVGLFLLNRRPWPDEVRAAAQKTVQDFSLQAGMRAAWDALHGDAVAAGLAGPYLGQSWLDLGQLDAGDIAAAPLGFASAYGANDASDDQAEYVAHVVISEYGTRAFCDRVKDAGSPFPIDRALPYVKIKLLEGLGLVDAAQVETCVGQPALEGPPGIHFGDAANLDQNIKGGFVDLDEGHFLGVLASAAPYQMLVRVLASERQPRGVFRLDNIGLFGINAATNAVLLGHDTEPLLARTSARGLVLVTEYSPQRLAGSIFFLMLRNAAGLVTDSFPFGTFRVDNPQ